MLNKWSLIFDLDNTLVECAEYYASAKRDFATLMCQKTGIPQDIAQGILEAIDAQSIKIDGFGRSRFPKSFQAASVAVDVLTGHPINSTRAKKAWSIGDSVFTAPYTLYPGALEALVKAKAMGFDLFLCTKGDSQVQLRKITKNKLNTVFPKGHIYIDVIKNHTHFTKIVQTHALDPLKTIVVGDSIKDDIGSANKAGLMSIFVSGQAVGGWTYENESYTPTHKINTINELVDLLATII